MKPWVKWTLIGLVGMAALGKVVEATRSPEEKAEIEAKRSAEAAQRAADKQAAEAAKQQEAEAKAAAERESFKQSVATLPKYSAREIAADYEANTVAADQKYKGKSFKVTGKITDINTGVTGNPYIVLAGVNMFLGPQLHFSKDYLQAISTAKKGMTITVLCEGGGDVVKTPMLQDCHFLPPDMRN